MPMINIFDVCLHDMLSICSDLNLNGKSSVVGDPFDVLIAPYLFSSLDYLLLESNVKKSIENALFKPTHTNWSVRFEQQLERENALQTYGLWGDPPLSLSLHTPADRLNFL